MVDFWITAIAWMSIGTIYSLLFGFFFFDKYKWISLRRKFQGRNLGIIFFKGAGRSLIPVIKDFDKDTIKTKKGIWILDKGKVYRQVGGEKKDEKPLSDANLEFRGGVPIIYFNIDDMVPLRFASDESSEESRNPEQVEATISKEIAAAEAEAIRMQKKGIQNAIIIVAIISIICLAACILNYFTINETKQMLMSQGTTINNMNILIESFVKASVATT